jgi:hypothetical protein
MDLRIHVAAMSAGAATSSFVADVIVEVFLASLTKQ